MADGNEKKEGVMIFINVQNMGNGQGLSTEYTTDLRGVGNPIISGNVNGAKRSELSGFFGKEYYERISPEHQLHIEVDESTGNFKGWLFRATK